MQRPRGDMIFSNQSKHMGLRPRGLKESRVKKTAKL